MSVLRQQQNEEFVVDTLVSRILKESVEEVILSSQVRVQEVRGWSR